MSGRSDRRASPSAGEAMAGAREIAPGVFVFTSAAYAMNSGVVLPSFQEPEPKKGRSGAASAGPPAAALLVDPGYFPAELDRVSAFLGSRGAEARKVVLTHADWDHIAGASRWTDAIVVASSEFPARTELEGEAIARTAHAFDRKLYVRREPPFAVPRCSALVGSPCDLVGEGPGAHALPARGHTSDSLMLLLRNQRVLFCGDYLSDREIPFIGDSLFAYAETLDQVRRLARGGRVEILVPGHGDVCGLDELLSRLDEDADYLERLDRWVKETRRTVSTLEGLLERSDEVVFRKGSDNPDVVSEHRANIARLFGQSGQA